MKNIFIIGTMIALLPLAMVGQRKSRSEKKDNKPENAYEIIFGRNDRDFKIKDVPDEWKNESAVILCQKTYVSYRDDYVALLSESGKEIQTQGLIRRSVKLLDNAAVEDFSEIYFQDGMKFNLTVIKENGDLITIDATNAVKVENEVPKIFRDSYKNESYLKVAVPKLAVGDIVDYTKEFEDNSTYSKEIFSLLSSYYPIVKQELIYDVDRGLTFIYNTFNNSSELKYDSKGGLKSNGKFSKKVKRYRLTNEMVPKIKDERWSYDYNSKPSLKVLVLCHAHFLAEAWDETLLQPNLEKFFKSTFTYENFSADIMIRKLYKAFKKTGLKKKPADEIVNTLYRATKFYFLYESSSEEFQNQIDKGDIFPLSRDRKTMNSAFFARVFGRLLLSFDIDAEYFMYASQRTGGYDNAVTFGELEFAVYVPELNKYYFTVDNYSYPGEIPSHALNAKGISSKVEDVDRGRTKLKDITVPNTNIEDNSYFCSTDVALDSEMELQYNQNVIAQGFYKAIYAPTFLYHSDFAKDYLIEYSHEELSEQIQLVHDNKGKDVANLEESLQTIFGQHKEFDEKKEEYILNWYKDEYSATDFEKLTINKYGINSFSEDLDFDVLFKATNSVKKAGPNLIIEVNQLIGDQIKLTDEDKKERFYDADLGHAKSIVNKITFSIPQGYSFKSIDELNVSIENEIAKFEAIASIENNTLVLNTTKDYKKGYINKTDFTKLAEVLDFTYDYSRKKIIVSKI